MIDLYNGDCLEKMREMSECSVDSIVTDPPYGLSFMGKKWDYDVPSVEIWKEALRVLKPGGHLLSFGGTRTYHRMVINIEDAGFEIRDQIMWIYGSGFPKSHNMPGGLGTALKPANEPICLARKPISEKTVASNVLKHGTGAMNIDESRVGTETIKHSQDKKSFQKWKELDGRQKKEVENTGPTFHQGRWPANVIFDEEAGKILDQQSGELGKSKGGNSKNVSNKVYGKYQDELDKKPCGFGDSGGASRFFYCAKTSNSERNAGLEEFPEKQASGLPMRSRDGERGGKGIDGSETDRTSKKKNHHPTVKPIKLMTYLIRLITPPNGIVLDPFMGSGSTGIAAAADGFKFIGIEKEEEYFKISQKRIFN